MARSIHRKGLQKVTELWGNCKVGERQLKKIITTERGAAPDDNSLLSLSALNDVLEHTNTVGLKHYTTQMGKWEELANDWGQYYSLRATAAQSESATSLSAPSSSDGSGSRVGPISKQLKHQLLLDVKNQMNAKNTDRVDWMLLRREHAIWRGYEEDKLKDTYRRAKKQRVQVQNVSLSLSL